MKVLVINSGSSSLKFTVFSMEPGAEKVLASGLVERLGLDDPRIIFKRPDGFKSEETMAIPDYSAALRLICGKLVDPVNGVIRELGEINAIGHRVLHGGEKLSKSVLITEEAKQIIRDCIPMGPLHNPANLSGIEACEKIFPGVPNVAVLDTAFHQTMPPEAYLYPLPYEMYEKHGIRRYGFHGTSHRYVCAAGAAFIGKKPEEINMITCHLGNGCSIAAIRNGKVIDTSMGLTPLEGLMMGTRCGDIDPAIVVRMIELGMTPKEADKVMNKQSGLLAVAGIGSSDMRDVMAAIEDGNPRAKLAFEMFIRRVVKYLGAYFVLLGGADLLVFTGGIGEFSAPARKAIMEQLACLGVKINLEANQAAFGKSGLISSNDSAWKVIVMPTNEELMIARDTVSIVSK